MNSFVKSRLALSVSVLALCTVAGPGQAEDAGPVRLTTPVLIDNGTIQLGVNPAGQIIHSALQIGLTFLPSLDAGLRAESLAPGCDCEGWGIADLTTGAFGEAGQDFGVRNVVEAGLIVTGTGTRDNSAGDTAVSTASVRDGALDLFVTHAYRPNAATVFLYQTDVTIRNDGAGPVGNLVYRRAMDWDIPELEFNEYVTIGGWPAANLIGSSNNGFVRGNPNIPLGVTGSQSPDLVLNRNFENAGPDDHGAAFDFSFGMLAEGDTQDFRIFYGAAPSEADAMLALGAVSAEVFSLGKVGDNEGRDAGTPHTFIFGFAGVGGTPVTGGPAIGAPINPLPELAGAALSRHRSLTSARLAPVAAGRVLGIDMIGTEPGQALGDWTFHLHAMGGSGDLRNRGNTIGHSFSTRGLAVALDRTLPLGEGTFDTGVFGAQLGRVQLRSTYDNGAGRVRGSATELMVYGQLSGASGLFVEGTAHYAALSYRQTRTGMLGVFNSRPKGTDIGAMLRLGRSVLTIPGEAGAGVLSGYGEVSADRTRIDSYTEDNAGLEVGGYSQQRNTVGVGMRYDAYSDRGDHRLVGGVDVAALYNLNNGTYSATQTTVGGAVSQRVARHRDGAALRVGASVGAVGGESWSAKLQVNTLVSRDLRRNFALAGEWRVRF